MAMLSSHIVSAVLWPSSSSSSSSSALVLQHRRRKPSLRWLRKPAVAGRSLHCITPPPAPSGGEGQAVVAPTTSVAALARRGAEGFDREGFEAERLRLDAEARVSMQEVSRSVEMGGSETEAPGAWKWAIRKRIWDLMEREDIAQNPRPVHHRIPNFVGAGAAAAKLASLPEFQSARCIKVNPDSPQKQVRYLTLNGGKKLLTPQPRLRTGFFSELDASLIPRAALSEACTPAGVAKNGKPLGLDAILKVDLIVIGSVAVDPKSGARLGKGEGFAELEYGMLRHMGAIDDSTLVVTSVHDKQLVDDIPVEKLLVHDVPVDVICTPTQIIYTNTTIPKPKGIYWDKLSPEKLGQIRVLRELKQRIERETGVKLPSGPSEKLPPTAERKPFGQGRETPNSSVLVWNLDARTRWQELKDHVARLGLPVLRVNVFKQPGYSKPVARVFFRQDANLQSAINTLNGSDLGGTLLRAKPDDAP